MSAYVARDRAEPFVAGVPLSRVAIVTRDKERYLGWTAHHHTYDGWSMKLLYQELENAIFGSKLTHVGDFRPFIAFREEQRPSEQEQYWMTALGDGSSISWPPRHGQNAEDSPRRSVVRSIGTAEAQRDGLRMS